MQELHFADVTFGEANILSVCLTKGAFQLQPQRAVLDVRRLESRERMRKRGWSEDWSCKKECCRDVEMAGRSRLASFNRA